MTTKKEMLDELREALNNNVHYYNGMLQQLANGSYDTDTARSDYEALMDLEDSDIIAILIDILKLDIAERQEDRA